MGAALLRIGLYLIQPFFSPFFLLSVGCSQNLLI